MLARTCEHIRRQRRAVLESRNRQLLAADLRLPLVSGADLGITCARAGESDFVAVLREGNVFDQRIGDFQSVAQIAEGNFIVVIGERRARNFNRLAVDRDAVHICHAADCKFFRAAARGCECDGARAARPARSSALGNVREAVPTRANFFSRRKCARVNHAAGDANRRRVRGKQFVRRLENNLVAAALEHIRRQSCARLQTRNRQLLAADLILPLVSGADLGITCTRAGESDFVAVLREGNVFDQRIGDFQSVAQIAEGNFVVGSGERAARNFD